MTINEISKNIGKSGIVNLKGLPVEVKILDAKISYGMTKYMITARPDLPPFNNSIWMDESSIKLTN